MIVKHTVIQITIPNAEVINDYIEQSVEEGLKKMEKEGARINDQKHEFVIILTHMT